MCARQGAVWLSCVKIPFERLDRFDGAALRDCREAHLLRRLLLHARASRVPHGRETDEENCICLISYRSDTGGLSEASDQENYGSTAIASSPAFKRSALSTSSNHSAHWFKTEYLGREKEACSLSAQILLCRERYQIEWRLPFAEGNRREMVYLSCKVKWLS